MTKKFKEEGRRDLFSNYVGPLWQLLNSKATELQDIAFPNFPLLLVNEY